MIKGMTGFGSAQIIAGKVKGVIEVKSNNSRYFDVAYYLPMGFASVENRIRQLLHKNIKRGRVTVSLKITEKPSQSLRFNQDAVKEYLKQARMMKKIFGLNNNTLGLSDVIRLPGVVEVQETMISGDKLWPGVEKNLKRSVDSLVRMRKREGKSLSEDILRVLKRMLLQVKKIQVRAKSILKEKKRKAAADEFFSFQKSSDINEELTRLVHYIEEFKLLLKSTASVGKKLDFVAQEMQRETNTIGSKLQDKLVSNAVIALKSKIEKLREQAQNIE